ncbi:hypothetical protein FGO68_gene10056 [Halteria grandinella]|uniref:UmuC domain-containing protein n=1 Tax=Halteria grandinella TaxID=5974 RepID=A0A8J8NX25_HALGN|nr:hypothetical protein FGO68_gene10056 [Halteria grandinella]
MEELEENDFLEELNYGTQELPDVTQRLGSLEEVKREPGLEHFERLIVHLDMDAYYAQVEMKYHNIDITKPVAVLQWNSIIALNYVAKNSGVKRSMTCYEALEVRSDMIFVHVATISDKQILGSDAPKTYGGGRGPPVKEAIPEQVKEPEIMEVDYFDYDSYSKQKEIPLPCAVVVDAHHDDEDFVIEDYQTFIPSSICKVSVLSSNKNLPPMKRFRVETREKEIQKFSHALYRNQSKKIFEILRRYGGIVEKASCDEAFIDLTECINKRYEELVRTKADSIFGEVLENWKEAYMFGHKEQGEGLFKPENLWDQKLFLANELAYQMRQDIKKELGYNASCGIGYNKTLAKIASAQNKPNAQTVVPIRYLQIGLQPIKINSVRFCGGKLGELLTRNGVDTMGKIQQMTVQMLNQMGLSESSADWLKNLSHGVCHESVKERNLPTTANAVKNFKKVHTLEQLENMITLVCYDIITKIKEYQEEFMIFPQTFSIGFFDVMDRNAFKSRRAKMVSPQDFNKDTRSIITIVREAIRAHAPQILPGASALSVSVMNFKPLSHYEVKTKALNTFFKAADYQEYAKLQEKERLQFLERQKQMDAQKLLIMQKRDEYPVGFKRSQPVGASSDQGAMKQMVRKEQQSKQVNGGIMQFFKKSFETADK